jgi:hypothetical protein
MVRSDWLAPANSLKMHVLTLLVITLLPGE